MSEKLKTGITLKRASSNWSITISAFGHYALAFL